MKTQLRILSVVLLLVTVTAVFASCFDFGTKLSGTYAKDIVAGTELSYTFSGNQVTVTTTVTFLGSVASEQSFTGTYEIKDDNITITLGGSDAAQYSGTFPFSKTDSSITIAGVTYDKK